MATGPEDLDLLALFVSVGNDAGYEIRMYSDFVLVDWTNEDKPFDLERGLMLPWLRMAQLVDKRIDVTVGEELFTTNMVKAQGDHWKVIHYLPDGDLLCRYLVKQVEVEQLRDNAGDIEEQIKATKLVEFYRDANKGLLDQNERFFAELEEKRVLLGRYQSAAQTWYSRFVKISEGIRDGLWSRKLNKMVSEAWEGKHDEAYDASANQILDCLR